MGFKVSDLVIGMGFFMVAVSGTVILFLAPEVYYAAELANRRNGSKQAKLANTTQTT